MKRKIKFNKIEIPEENLDEEDGRESKIIDQFNIFFKNRTIRVILRIFPEKDPILNEYDEETIRKIRFGKIDVWTFFCECYFEEERSDKFKHVGQSSFQKLEESFLANDEEQNLIRKALNDLFFQNYLSLSDSQS